MAQLYTHDDESRVAVFMRVVEVHPEQPRHQRDDRHRKHARGQQQLQLNQLVTVAVQLNVQIVLQGADNSIAPEDNTKLGIG
jgi:hypothetical protein